MMSITAFACALVLWVQIRKIMWRILCVPTVTGLHLPISVTRHYPNGDFTEASHRDCDGDTGILEIVRAYHDCGYTGYVRPDHGRHIWGEQCRPGYGLYDRALGIMYLWGCWDMLERTEGKVSK